MTRKKRHQGFTEKDRDRLFDLYINQRLSYKAIADRENCASSYIRTSLIQLGIPIQSGRQRNPQWSEESKQQARERFKKVQFVQINETTEECIQKFKLVHGNRYDYSKVVYSGSQIPVEIICNKHGSFFQTPAVHKQNRGCTNCGIEKLSGNYTHNRKMHIKQTDYDKKAYFYVVQLQNDNEIFYKCGITSQRSIVQRFSGHCPYDVQVLQCEPTTLQKAYLKEQSIIKQ